MIGHYPWLELKSDHLNSFQIVSCIRFKRNMRTRNTEVEVCSRITFISLKHVSLKELEEDDHKMNPC